MAILYNQLKDNFTQIPNELLTDDRLSNGAKVIYCYVASKPTGWKVWNAEIQKALNIKDKGTMSKYWKELLDTGWIDRTRNKTDNGQFSGGYDYELRISPNTENIHRQEKPEYGENPPHNNTNLISNTNINNNIIISEEENSNILNNPKGQLFATETKPKKAKENKYVEIINDLSSNEQIKNALLGYCNFRRTRGLTAQQWRAMLQKFKNDSKEKSVEEILKCIEQCLINGRNSLYYSEGYNQNKKNAPPAVVDDSGPAVIRRRKT